MTNSITRRCGSLPHGRTCSHAKETSPPLGDAATEKGLAPTTGSAIESTAGSASLYLGRAGALVERVRQALGAQQQAITRYRLFDRLVRQVRASLRIEKIRLRSLLCPFGLRLKGWEVRGWRISPLRWLLPSRRRLFPAVAMRARRMRRRPPNDPVARLHRFLEARDGYVLDGDVGRAMETPHLRR